MTKDKLEAKIKELETGLENAKANLYAIQGALHSNKQWLDDLSKTKDDLPWEEKKK